MGVVARAVRGAGSSAVAIKFIKVARLGHRDAAKRLIREARAAAKLQSPHSVKVLEVAETEDGAPFIVMEHLEGETFAEHLRRHGALAVALACRWIEQVCD